MRLSILFFFDILSLIYYILRYKFQIWTDNGNDQKISKGRKTELFLLGPRGTGKSTFIRNAFPEALYVDLLLPDVFRNYSARPERLREAVHALKGTRTVIIDEVQKAPQLIEAVHSLIEEKSGIQCHRGEKRFNHTSSGLACSQDIRRGLSRSEEMSCISRAGETYKGRHFHRTSLRSPFRPDVKDGSNAITYSCPGHPERNL